MKIIQNVSQTNYSIVAKTYGSLKIDKIVYIYLHQHDVLIPKTLYGEYKKHKSFEDFLNTYKDA